jgi:hypothetical protein
MKRDGEPGEATSDHDRIEVPWFWEGKVHGAGSYPIFSVGILGAYLDQNGGICSGGSMNLPRHRAVCRGIAIEKGFLRMQP